MRSSMFRAAALLCGAAVALGAQPAPAPEANGSIEGRVLNALSGEGLRKVTLTLAATGGKDQSTTAQTDAEGRFAFRDLTPGSYRLSGERTGFQRQDYGARLDPSSGAALKVAPGEQIKDLTFKLAPSAILSGRVLDQAGEPMPTLVVSAVRSSYVRGRKQWVSSGGAQTDDRGEFRIGGLRAGRYIVCASNLNLGIGLVAAAKGALPEKPEEGYASTCYGNSVDVANAVPVEVRMGEDHRGTDIQMAKTSTVRIRGKVSGATEGKVMAVMLMRKGTGWQNPGSLGVVQQIDSTFELRNVTPGSYVLLLRSITDMAGTAAAPLPLEVAGRHVEGVELALGAGSPLRGRFVIAPDKSAAGKNPAAVLDWVDYSLPDAGRGTAGDDGAFTIPGVFPGRYRLRVESLPDGAYVKAVRLGGRDVDETSIDVAAGGELEIAVSRSGAQVEGVVKGAEDKPVSGALVALIPESGRETHYHTATTDHDGTFRVKGIPPGKYKVLAWEEIEPGAFRDREFVKPFEEQAQTLALEENGRTKVTLTAIPSASR